MFLSKSRLPAVIVLLSALTACGGAHVSKVETVNGKKVERIYNNLGGFVDDEMAAWRSRVNAHGIQAFIVDGTCASFCTFVALYSPDSCYTRNVRFYVHAASSYGLVETPATKAFTREAVSYWPKGLRDWWNKTRPGTAGVTLRYSDLKRIIPERACPPNLVDGDARQRISSHSVREVVGR